MGGTTSAIAGDDPLRRRTEALNASVSIASNLPATDTGRQARVPEARKLGDPPGGSARMSARVTRVTQHAAASSAGLARPVRAVHGRRNAAGGGCLASTAGSRGGTRWEDSHAERRLRAPGV